MRGVAVGRGLARGDAGRARGPHGEYAAAGAELAHLVAEVDCTLARAEVSAAPTRSPTRAWPGAAQAALWLADWLRRAAAHGRGRGGYTASPRAGPSAAGRTRAARGRRVRARCARLGARARASRGRCPTRRPADRHVRDDLLAAAARGARLARTLHRGVVGCSCSRSSCSSPRSPRQCCAGAGAALRGLRPPVEVVFLAPVAGVLVAVALTAHEAIAPAVARISAGRRALAWLSGAALERLRADRRPLRVRAALHVGACFVAVVASGYLALAHDGLLDLLIQTVRVRPRELMLESQPCGRAGDGSSRSSGG